MAADQGVDYWLNPEDVKIPDGAPEPVLWRLLVVPVQPRRQSKGGIVLPDETREAEEHLSYIGKVIALGPMAGKKPEWPEGAYDVKVGDWILFGRYSGQKIEYQGVKFLFLDDDNVLGKCSGPEGFRIYV